MKKRLKLLITALKNHHEAMVKMHETRSEAVKLIGVLSVKTPLFEHAGQLANADDSLRNTCSYASINTDMAAQYKLYTDRFLKYVVEYAIDWERIVTKRISEGLKKGELLRVELDHYQSKVEGMRTAANVTLAKKKMVDPKTAEKLSRNEEKLLNSRREYEKFKNALCLLIDEATLRSWKDLHPLLVKICQFDLTTATSEAKAFSKLNTVISNLKAFADRNNLTGESRLNNLESMDAYQLSGTVEKEPLMLENVRPPTSSHDVLAGMDWNGGMQMSSHNSASDFQNQPSQMGFGMTSPSNDFSQFQSQHFGTDPSLGHLTNAAPAPTVESLQESTQFMSINTSASKDNGLHSNLNFSGGHDIPSSNGGGIFDSFPGAGPNGPTVPPPQMPPPLPPSQALTISSRQNNHHAVGLAQDPYFQQQQRNHYSQSYQQNLNNPQSIMSPTSAGATMNSSGHENTFTKNPFDEF